MLSERNDSICINSATLSPVDGSVGSYDSARAHQSPQCSISRVFLLRAHSEDLMYVVLTQVAPPSFQICTRSVMLNTALVRPTKGKGAKFCYHLSLEGVGGRQKRHSERIPGCYRYIRPDMVAATGEEASAPSSWDDSLRDRTRSIHVGAHMQRRTATAHLCVSVAVESEGKVRQHVSKMYRPI